jgi:AAA domain/RepB DNA-primase from phage plasmid
MMKEGTAAVQSSTVREFLHIIAAQAKAALNGVDRPGFLQISRLHPASEDLVPSRYQLDDLEHMIGAAVADSAAGHNVYIEGRTVREELRGNGRGKLEDTRAVFAIVVDSDADKQMGWTPNVPVSLTVATSPGNFQYWFFLRKAIGWRAAQKLGERIRKAVNSDHDTGNPVQPYRVAGTVNYPSKTKIERGRVTVATQLVEFDPEGLWSLRDLARAFPRPPRQSNGDARSAGAAAGTTDTSGIPPDTMQAIREGVEKNARSDVFWNVMLVLKGQGFTIDSITALLEQHPNGIALKYRGRLRKQVEHIYNKIQERGGPAKAPQPISPTESVASLRTMTFTPIKYVVPGILVEGLTLFAGKPKVGKSWLLLHAAIAVARGGFTLGETHCIEGDVLYCALEDNRRRLKSRIDKLVGSSSEWPARLFYRTDLPLLTEGGLDVLREWILSVPHARLIVIDTLAMVRAPKKHDESSYASDYSCVLELRQLASDFGIAIAVVHHLRKADSDDAFDTVSGTLGLTGAPDTVLVLKRDSSGNLVLHGRGRDLPEIEKAMIFDRDACAWRVAGEADMVRRSTERAAVLGAIKEAKDPIGPNDIAAIVGMRAINVRKLLAKLIKEGAIKKTTYGRYEMQPEGGAT